MKELNTNVSNVVIVGAWNMAIFSDRWVRENLLKDSGEVKVYFPMNIMSSMKFVTESFSFYIVGERLCFELTKYDDEAARQMVKVIRKILQLLPYTPINSFGINFVFEDDKPYPIGDDARTKSLVEKTGYAVQNTSVKRTFRMADNVSLNLTISQGEKAHYDFNFDYRANSATDVTNAMSDTDDVVVNRHDDAVKMACILINGGGDEQQ